MAALAVSIESSDGGGILSRCQWGIAVARERKDTNGEKKNKYQTAMNPMRRKLNRAHLKMEAYKKEKPSGGRDNDIVRYFAEKLGFSQQSRRCEKKRECPGSSVVHQKG